VRGPILERAKKDFQKEISKSSACGHRPAVTRKKEAVSGSCSEQDDSASGFAWVAREPQLMLGQRGAHPHRDSRSAIDATAFSALPALNEVMHVGH
jgi:hypothetical protein